MVQDTAQDEPPFKVACAWCGEVISLSSFRDIEAMCLGCYHDMLAGHFRAEAQGEFEPFASER